MPAKQFMDPDYFYQTGERNLILNLTVLRRLELFLATFLIHSTRIS